jgi:hypothetical protein
MSSPVTSVRTAFRPAEHGFAFANCFPQGKPIWTFRTPRFTIPVGDASKGICGGMVFAARDYQLHGRPVPRDPETPGLYPYIARRLWHSFGVPWGVTRIYQWTARPDVARRHPTATVPYLTTQREWPRVRAALDRGEPAPLMLIKAASRNPWDMGLNHQVLATGYDEDRDTGDVTVHLYEPNYPITGPSDEDVTLRFDVRSYDGRRVVHSREGESVRGFFLNDRYSPMRPPTEQEKTSRR